MSDLAIIGPVAVRRFELEHVCNVSEGHEHNYDHTTVVISGRVCVSVEGAEDREYGQGDCIPILAGKRHTLKALDDGTRYLCVFSHRDFDGLVTQDYRGNIEATR